MAAEYLLLENGNRLIWENGDAALLESSTPSAPTACLRPGPGRRRFLRTSSGA